MELEREQLKAQLWETDDQLSKLLPRQIHLCWQLGCLSQKEADAICRELSAIEDQESLDTPGGSPCYLRTEGQSGCCSTVL